MPSSLCRGIFLLTFKRCKETWICNLCKTTFFKRSERDRAALKLKCDYHSLFSVNPKNLILLKTYYLSNSFLQSQARKCSCNHSLRPYMLRCLDTGLDNSHQCLKREKDIVKRNDNNKISISTRNERNSI